MRIKRRSFIAGGFGLAATAAVADTKRWPHFPYKLIEVHGRDALSRWEALAAADDGTTPVVIGNAEDVDRMVWMFDPAQNFEMRSPDEILVRAAELSHPDALIALRVQELKQSESYYNNSAEDRQRYAAMLAEAEAGLDGISEDMIGDWPDQPPISPGLSIVTHWRTGQQYDQVYIALLPTRDPTAIPAYMNFGGWNANPPPEYHVAALRAWSASFGVRLIGMTGDVLNMRVERPLASKDEALQLAKEQYIYCEDIVTQGVGDLAVLAAALYEDNWWYFWWD